MKKKWLTIALSCLLATTTAFSSLAAGGGLNGGGSGSSKHPSTIEYISSMHAYQINNGIQMCIVRKDNGRLVSNIVTMNNYLPTEINSAPDGQLKQYWNTYMNRTGIFNKAKDTIIFLNGAKTDKIYSYSIVDLKNPQPNSGVMYPNRITGEPDEGKMYTYADIEFALEKLMDKYFNDLHPELSEQYRAAGGSPISLSGGVYKATGIDRKIHGPVEVVDGHNVATGDTFRDQMNTSLPGNTYVIQFLLELRLTKADGLGHLDGSTVEPLFKFTDTTLQKRYDELVAQGAQQPMIQVMKENNLYASFEDIAWQVNEVVNPKAPEGYNKTGYTNEQFWNSPAIYYGTPTIVSYRTCRDFVDYLNRYKELTRAKDPNKAEFYKYLDGVAQEIGKAQIENPDDNKWLRSLPAWLKKNNISQAWDWSLAYQAFTLHKSEPQMRLKTFADLGLDSKTVDTKLAGDLNFWLTHMFDLGYGVMLFSPVPEGATSTFDEVNYSSSSKEGYRPGPSEDTSKNGGKESQNNIVKFYATNKGGSYVYTENYTRSNTLGSITLEDEEGYKVDNWFTSSTFKEPKNKSDSYDNWKASIENKQTGDKTGVVKIDKKETLYLRLVESPVIIKVYETGGQVNRVVTDTNPRYENNKLVVTTPDNGYEYIEAVQSDEKKNIESWDDVPGGDNTTATEIDVKNKVVYLHYHKENTSTGLVLHENELSHQFSLSDVNGTLLNGIRKYSSVSVSGSCPEEWYCSDEDCDGHRCGASYDYTGSDDWTFKIENVPNYSTELVWKWIQTDQQSYTGNGLSESGGEGVSTPDMKMILQRSISDKATLYPGLNGGNTGTLISMGLQGESYKPAGKRNGGSNQAERKTWNENFTTNWKFTEFNSPVAHFETDHGYSKTDEHTSTGNEDELNSAYSKAGNVQVFGVWGKANTGAATVNESANNNKWTVGDMGTQLRFTGLATKTVNKPMTFYPYYRMKYVSELDQSEQDVYLTSENLSSVLGVQRVDTAMFKSQAGNTLDLSSTQWSIHSGAQSLLAKNGVQDKDSLLPAGAIYTLSSAGNNGNASPIWIGYRIFNSYALDKNALADSNGIKNRDEVINTINQFKADTDRVVDGLEVVMYGKEGIDSTSNETEFWNSSKQITGKNGQYGIGGQKFISDKKYDLKTGGTGADSSDVSILERKEELYDWVISSDVDGNVTVTRNGEALEVIAKNSSVIKNSDVKEFNDRTKLVSNYLQAVDRNLGKDRAGRSWYNEGFSVGCIEERYAVRVGFGDGANNMRSAALNIKANGKLDSRHDMFTGGDTKTRTYQFFTAPRSTVSDAGAHNIGWIGTYDGTDIQLPNIHLLLCSKKFYVGNTTVMDLN